MANGRENTLIVPFLDLLKIEIFKFLKNVDDSTK